MSSTYVGNITLDLLTACVQFFRESENIERKKEKAFCSFRIRNSIPFSADWALEIGVVVADAEADAEVDEAAAVWWWGSCKVECFPSAEVLFFNAEDASLSFVLDFSPSFDVKRSFSACITDAKQKWQGHLGVNFSSTTIGKKNPND